VDQDGIQCVEEFIYIVSAVMKEQLHKEDKCSLCLLLPIVESTLLEKMNQAEDSQQLC
jgi:hypothetical protein